jgi:hypothetical protein
MGRLRPRHGGAFLLRVEQRDFVLATLGAQVRRDLERQLGERLGRSRYELRERVSAKPVASATTELNTISWISSFIFITWWHSTAIRPPVHLDKFLRTTFPSKFAPSHLIASGPKTVFQFWYNTRVTVFLSISIAGVDFSITNSIWVATSAVVRPLMRPSAHL